jgi:hypothetical protein
VYARVAICGIGGIELVAVAYPAETGWFNVVEEFQVVVSRNAKDGANAELFETGEEVCPEGNRVLFVLCHGESWSCLKEIFRKYCSSINATEVKSVYTLNS